MNDALLERIAVALESIAGSLERISQPPQVGHLPPWNGGKCIVCGGVHGKHYQGCANGDAGIPF